MVDFGHLALCLAFILTLVAILSGVIGGWRESARWTNVSRQATILVAVSVTVAFFVLAAAFLGNDYSIQYVWQFSNRDMLPIYKISAIWGGMDGSMLLWAWILSLAGGLMALQIGGASRRIRPWALCVFNGSTLFFLIVTVFVTNPFRALGAGFIPADGNGLNPLLQHPLMAIHPPLLYLGFTTFTVPFAYCIAALLSGEMSNDWIRLTRRWTIFAWAALTTGIMLGGHWAYVELGWGGFWAWDPVENASFLPWLTGTAYLHSIMVQQRKDMLKTWNVWLITLTYGLTVFGTFLTRSGVVQSVHAFASTDVGWVFLVYLGILFGGTLALTIYRRRELRPARVIESFLSREAAFLLNNLLFLGICFTTLLGVLFPIISEWVTGQQIATGIPWYNAVNGPQFILLLGLMGIGPLIAWRKATWQSLRRTFLAPFAVAFVATLAIMLAGISDFKALAAYGCSLFAVMTVLAEGHRALRIQRANNAESGVAASVQTLVRRHRARYGGYLVHVGVAIAAIAITASMIHKIEREFTLAKGEEYAIGRFVLQLTDFRPARNDNFESLAAVVQLKERKSGKVLREMTPEKRFYLRSREPTTEVALRVGLREDVYLALAGFDESGSRATFKVFVNPLQVWLWIGVLVMVGGAIILLVPERERALAPSGAALESRGVLSGE